MMRGVLPDAVRARTWKADFSGAVNTGIARDFHAIAEYLTRDSQAVARGYFDGDRVEPRPRSEHIYFAVPDLEDAFLRAERAGGLSTETGDGNLPMGKIAERPWGERSFYMADPSGNPLCFVDEKTAFTTGLI